MKWTPITESEAIDDDIRKEISELLQSEEWEYICSEEQDYNMVSFIYDGLLGIAIMVDHDPNGNFYRILSGKYLYAFNDLQGMILVARILYNGKKSSETIVETVTQIA